MVSTIRAICRQLMMGSLVLRYEIGTAADDGLTAREGYFTTCALWLVEAMARAGFAEEAQLTFEKLHTFAKPPPLFSEEISSRGELVGNFPQALTHLALIRAGL